MKKIKLFTSLATIILGATTLTGCGEKPLELEIADFFDTAYIGYVYDFGDYITKQSGVEYSIEAYYHNYYEKKEYAVACDGLTFTPTEQFEITVITHAKKGNQEVKKTSLVPVALKGDPLDELLVSGGYSGWADPGWRKELTDIESYLHNNDTNNQKSATSLVCSYSGTDSYAYGASLLCINNFRCLEHWTDKTWENAIISCWVYNPTDYDLEFQLRICDEYNDKKVDIDWSHEMNIKQFAEKKDPGTQGKWSRLIFSLKKVGINHTLFVNEDETRNDSITIKCQWKGKPVNGVYTYQFYVDGIDIVPHDYNEYYKSIDTRYPDKVEDNILSAWSDYGVLKTANYKDKEGDDPTKVVSGDSSIKYTFDYDEAAKYTDPAYNNGAAFMTIDQQKIWDDFTAQGNELQNAILKFKVFNSSDADLEFALRATDASQGVDFDWTSDKNIYKHIVVSPGEWTTVAFSLRKCGIRDTVTYLSREFPNLIIAKVQYKGDRTLQGYTFSFYVDDIDVIKAEDYPDPIDTRGLTATQNVAFVGWSEDGFSKEAYYGTDPEKVLQGSDSSLHYSFTKPSPTAVDTYGLMAICLNNKSFHLVTTDKTWTDSILQFSIFNPNSEDIEFGMYVYENDQEGEKISVDWPTSEALCPHVLAKAGQWTLVRFDLSKMGLTWPIYYQNDSYSHEFSIKAKYLGDTSSDYSFDFYIDGIDVISRA